MTVRPEVSVVLPIYEEEENIPILLGEIRAAMEPLGRPYEVLCVDDGSGDGSWSALRRAADGYSALRALRFRQNRGQTAAMVAGFREALGDIIVTMDSDLQNDPADIPRLLDALKDHDVVLGVRERRNDNWLRRLSSRLANRYRRKRTGDEAIDTGCSLKAFRAAFVRDIPPYRGMHRYLPVLVRMAGAERIHQVMVNHRPRIHGVAKYGVWNRLWVGIADVKAVRWMQRRHFRYEIAEQIVGEEAVRDD